MKKRIIIVFALFLIFLLNISIQQNKPIHSDFSLSNLVKIARADGETTVADCRKKNCLPSVIYCTTECDGYTVSFPWAMARINW